MRYIVAYGGDVCSCVEEGPTHVACHSMEDIPEVPAGTVVVQSTWISDSVRKGSLCSHTHYSL